MNSVLFMYDMYALQCMIHLMLYSVFHNSLCEIFLSAAGHLSDRLNFLSGQNENLPDRKKYSASVYQQILIINLQKHFFNAF